MTGYVLVVEDEQAIGEMIKMSLEKDGHQAKLAQDAKEAKEIVANEPIELALVDWMLPGSSGIELVRYLRKDEVTHNMPIIMLTAKGEETDITTGLDAGADDYVPKPFSPRELNSRINALLRRSKAMAHEKTTCGQLVCDSSAHRISVDNTELELSHTEFKLLQFFMQNPDRVYTRAQLLDHVWGRGTYIEERTVDVHVLRLRKILKKHSLDQIIQTVRGAGYRLSGLD